MNSNRQALVFGATSFIGGWLVKELHDQGIPTTAAVRTLSRFDTLRRWLANPTGFSMTRPRSSLNCCS